MKMPLNCDTDLENIPKISKRCLFLVSQITLKGYKQTKLTVRQSLKLGKLSVAPLH